MKKMGRNTKHGKKYSRITASF